MRTTPMRALAAALACLFLVPAAARAVTVSPGAKGMNINWFNAPDKFTSAQQDQALADIKAIGGAWVKVGAPWYEVQPTPTAWNWSGVDNFVGKATAHGLQPLLTFSFCTPGWAKTDPACDAVPDAAHLGAWQAFVAAAAQRYHAKGVHAYEILSEVNFHNTAAAYGPVLKAAFQAIRNVDPLAEVVSAGITQDNGSGLNYLQALYNLGYGGYFTAYGAHPYDYVTPPPNGNWAWLPKVAALMAQHGQAGKKIWITEAGYASCHPTNASWTQQREASWLTATFNAAQAASWAGPVFWYSYRDDNPDCSTWENKYGIVNYDFSPKLAYAAYKSVPGGTTPTPSGPDMTAFLADLGKIQTAAAAVKTTADLSSLDALIAQLQAALSALETQKAALAKSRRLP